MELIIGTANFESTYGVANNLEKMSRDICHEVLDFAYSRGVVSLDTAKNYGKAESVIGDFHKSGRIFRVFTKVSDLNQLKSDELVEQAQLAIQSLKLRKLSGFYFHNSKILRDYPQNKVKVAIKMLADSGLVERIGVSVYDEEEIEWISKTFSEIKLFQVPENILDRRLIDSKVIRELNESGIEFHVRSIFLQGLLLMEPSTIPGPLQQTIPAINSLRKFSDKHGMSVLEICLSYLSLINWASSYVVGVANKEQLKSILQSRTILLDRSKLPPKLKHDIIDPRNWHLK